MKWQVLVIFLKVLIMVKKKPARPIINVKYKVLYIFEDPVFLWNMDLIFSENDLICFKYNMFLFLSGNEIKRDIPSWNFHVYKF